MLGHLRLTLALFLELCAYLLHQESPFGTVHAKPMGIGVSVRMVVYELILAQLAVASVGLCNIKRLGLMRRV